VAPEVAGSNPVTHPTFFFQLLQQLASASSKAGVASRAALPYFSVNVISSAIRTRTALPSFLPGSNVHFRAALTAS
jgi:hypothetical protein